MTHDSEKHDCKADYRPKVEVHLSIGSFVIDVNSEVLEVVYTLPKSLQDTVSNIVTCSLIRTAEIVSIGHPDDTHQNGNHQPKAEFPGLEGGEEQALTDNKPSVDEM